MKKLYAFVWVLMMLPAVAFAATPAVSFVNQLTDQIIQNVLASDKPKEEKLVEFRKDFTEALDLKSIGQFVLGVYWRKATPSEREAFLTAFMDFTTKTWADRFDMYHGQTIVFTGERESGKNQVYVDSQIQNNPPVEVIWRLREKNGSYRIIDIIVEGVSMAMSYRNEYTSFLQAHGGQVSALTRELETKSREFQFTDSLK